MSEQDSRWNEALDIFAESISKPDHEIRAALRASKVVPLHPMSFRTTKIIFTELLFLVPAPIPPTLVWESYFVGVDSWVHSVILLP